MPENLVRVWITDDHHDKQVKQWVDGLSKEKDELYLLDHLKPVEEDNPFQVGKWQVALLAAECVALLRGGQADLHEKADQWLDKVQPNIDDLAVNQALEVVEKALDEESSISKWWDDNEPDLAPFWQRSLEYLYNRIKDGAEAEIPD